MFCEGVLGLAYKDMATLILFIIKTDVHATTT